MKQSATYLLPFLVCLFLTGVLSAQDMENMFRKDSTGFWKQMFTGDPFSVSGSVGANMRSYNAWNTPDRQTPLSTTIYANATVKSYRITIPFSLLINNLDVASTPFTRTYFEGILTNQRNRLTRFGISPYYKWAKVHLGHRYMNFSEFTLNNHNFLGAGVELNPGKFRFAAMAGRLAKAEPINLSLNRPNFPVYERTGWGFKIGYGTASDYADLILFKAQEDPNSIPAIRDSNAVVLPGENLVLGLKIHKKLFKGLRFEFDGAHSAFTRNNEDPKSDASFFLYNSGLFQQRASTVYRNALSTALRYRLRSYSIGLEYRRIDPGYRSLGTYFFNDDFEDVTLQFSGAALKRKLNFRTSGGIQHNNLDGSKQASFTRFIGSVNLNYQVRTWMLGLDVSNFSSRVDYLLDPNADSLKVVVVTRESAGNISKSFGKKGEARQTVTLTGGVQSVTNNLTTPAGFVGSSMYFGNLAYSVNTPGHWQWSANADYNNNALGGDRQSRYGAGTRLNRSFKSNRYNAGVGSQFYRTTFTGSGNNLFNHYLNASYRTKTRHTFNLQCNVIQSKRTLNGETKRFSELIASVGYSTQFGISNRQAQKDLLPTTKK